MNRRLDLERVESKSELCFVVHKIEPNSNLNENNPLISTSVSQPALYTMGFDNSSASLNNSPASLINSSAILNNSSVNQSNPSNRTGPSMRSSDYWNLESQHQNLPPLLLLSSVLFLAVLGMIISVRKLLQVQALQFSQVCHHQNQFEELGEPLPQYKFRSSLLLNEVHEMSAIAEPPPAYVHSLPWLSSQSASRS